MIKRWFNALHPLAALAVVATMITILASGLFGLLAWYIR